MHECLSEEERKRNYEMYQQQNEIEQIYILCLFMFKHNLF